MCAIIDAANVASELWEHTGNDAGRGFRAAVDNGRIPLVSGGSKMGTEVAGSGQRMLTWFAELRRSGKLTMKDDQQVDDLAARLQAATPGTIGACQSNDHHIIALAQVSGARLLYTNDNDLMQDFDDRHLISKPRGKVYSTSITSDFSRQRRDLLARKDLCR